MEQRERASLWTIKELGQRVARALSRDYEGPANGQVRAIPDRRTIRYYTTLGLLDGPARMRGRTALYGHRHLLQVVAIKRLQARGLALATIQEELAGLSDAGLARLARLSPELTAVPPRRSQRKFWAEVPDATPQPVVPRSITRLTALCLAPGATLLLDTARQVDGEELMAVEAAAEKLIDQLKTLGLLPGTQKE